MRLCIVLLLLCALVSMTADAFSFNLEVNSIQCFVEEVPSNCELTVFYSASDAYGRFIDVSLTSPRGEVIIEDNGKRSARYTLHALDGGEYKLCIRSKQASGIVKPKHTVQVITIEFNTNIDTIEFQKIATQEKLKPIETQVRALEGIVRSIHTEYIYFKEKEAEMRSTNESMSSKLIWVSATIILFFALFWFLQLRHLKQYFRKKRMID